MATDYLKKNLEAVLLVLGILCLVGGICVLCLLAIDYTETYPISQMVERKVIDYTDCKRTNADDTSTFCHSVELNPGDVCVCDQIPVIFENDTGPITVYYLLEGFNTSLATESRDNSQLSGKLDLIPSEQCEPYRYEVTGEGNKPIVPCGAMADAMFNDSMLIRETNDEPLPRLFSGLISDKEKEGYQNPPGNLSIAFRNYSKPVNWVKSIGELKPEESDASENVVKNIGLQNEGFILWMKSDPKKGVIRNPLWKLKTKLTPGKTYNVYPEYNYPRSRHAGKRKFLLVSEEGELVTKTFVRNEWWVVLGVALVIFGSLGIASAAYQYIHYRKSAKEAETSSEVTNKPMLPGSNNAASNQASHKPGDQTNNVDDNSEISKLNTDTTTGARNSSHQTSI